MKRPESCSCGEGGNLCHVAENEQTLFPQKKLLSQTALEGPQAANRDSFSHRCSEEAQYILRFTIIFVIQILDIKFSGNMLYVYIYIYICICTYIHICVQRQITHHAQS